jgi:hypothetical protein
MTKTSVPSPTISLLLHEFFADYKPGASPAARARIAIVRVDLDRHLEAEGPRILTTGQLAILASEKQFGSPAAFARTMHADDLYYALSLYLDPASALDGLAERTTQLDVIAALAESLWSRRLVSNRNVSECAAIEFDIGLQRGRALIRAARAAVRSAG